VGRTSFKALREAVAMHVATPTQSKPSLGRSPRSARMVQSPTQFSFSQASSGAMSLTAAAHPRASLAAPRQEQFWPSDFWRPWTPVNQNGGTYGWTGVSQVARPPLGPVRRYQDPPASAGSASRARGNFLAGSYTVLTPPSTPRLPRVRPDIDDGPLSSPCTTWGGGLGPPLGSQRSVQAMYSEKLSKPKKNYYQ
jgi:hypothetical protein